MRLLSGERQIAEGTTNMQNLGSRVIAMLSSVAHRLIVPENDERADFLAAHDPLLMRTPIEAEMYDYAAAVAASRSSANALETADINS